jgi:hypothetical protein
MREPSMLPERRLDHRKDLAEIEKLMIETLKMHAEIAKINAETLKSKRENTWLPFVWFTGFFAAAVGFAKVFMA